MTVTIETSTAAELQFTHCPGDRVFHRWACDQCGRKGWWLTGKVLAERNGEAHQRHHEMGADGRVDAEDLALSMAALSAPQQKGV